ncbi:MAG: hypothetical protein KME15_00690 [Drouetiella hepatica Uher 2000/2452]|jgi:hypothetical protein|uniref:KGK family protein n=1 Tax=Drouetiella hepatica Uher 2000/2452 TaxID=904376 RepID=A0A951Q8D8_9CYAN|nr:hypothetical protein [Drouetiella hepatica Uher 2000/2452]
MRDALEALNELNDKDVIAFGNDILKVDSFRSAVQDAISFGVLDGLNKHLTKWKVPALHQWFTEGTNCEVLSLGSGDWKKGKIKFTVLVEFLPDEPEIPYLPVSNAQVESPLDDIRQMLNEAS